MAEPCKEQIELQLFKGDLNNKKPNQTGTGTYIHIPINIHMQMDSLSQYPPTAFQARGIKMASLTFNPHLPEDPPNGLSPITPKRKTK